MTPAGHTEPLATIAGLNPETVAANAALIASAPELLAAVGDMLSLAETYDVGQNSAIVDRARAALARAEGRT